MNDSTVHVQLVIAIYDLAESICTLCFFNPLTYKAFKAQKNDTATDNLNQLPYLLCKTERHLSNTSHFI